jgi:SAM-dependent methyltransferase
VETWKFYDITHRDHVVCNPTSVARLDELIGWLDLPRRPRILDAGCGKGELLLRVAERYGGVGGEALTATAIDLSPYCVADLRSAIARRAPKASIDVLQMDAGAFAADPGAYDLACALGVSWAYGGHRGAIQRLAAAVRPGGQVLVGEPYWRREPEQAYLDWSGMRRDEFGSHAGNVEVGVEEGLVPLIALASNEDEWDRYETLQWRATARYATANPADPDTPELVARVARNRHEYLTWGRETLGWSLYLFGVPGTCGVDRPRRQMLSPA